MITIPSPQKSAALLHRCRQEVSNQSSAIKAVNRADGELKFDENTAAFAINSNDLTATVKTMAHAAIAESVRNKQSVRGAMSGKTVHIEIKNEQFVDKLRNLIDPRLSDQNPNPHFTENPKVVVGANSDCVMILFVQKEVYKEALGVHKAMGFEK